MFMYYFFFGILLEWLHLSCAALVETTEQCASIMTSAAENLFLAPGSLTQTFYPPKQTTLTNFIATCTGSTKLPVISDNGNSLDSIERFVADDCGYTSTNSCCMVDPSPGELLCDFSRYARCKLYHSPEDPYQVTCRKGILRILTPASETWVLDDEDDYRMHFSGYNTPILQQPDGSLRFSPKQDDGSTRAIVARPNDLIDYLNTCEDNIAVDFPELVYSCMGVNPTQVSTTATAATTMASATNHKDSLMPSSTDCVRLQEAYDTYAGSCLAQMLFDPPQCNTAPYCHGLLGICLLHECEEESIFSSCSSLPYCTWIDEDALEHQQADILTSTSTKSTPSSPSPANDDSSESTENSNLISQTPTDKPRPNDEVVLEPLQGEKMTPRVLWHHLAWVRQWF